MHLIDQKRPFIYVITDLWNSNSRKNVESMPVTKKKKVSDKSSTHDQTFYDQTTDKSVNTQ